MTTRTPPTADDLAGRSQRGREAYNQRRRLLRDRGITIVDLYNDDQLDDESDPTGAQRFWRQWAADEAKNAALERQWSIEDDEHRLPRH